MTAINWAALAERAAQADPADDDGFTDAETAEVYTSVETPYTRSLIEWEGFFSRDFNTRDWLVEPFLARGRSHAVVAGAKTGKSLLMLEVALALATGKAVLNQAAGDPVSVLYADHEMTDVDVFDRATKLGYGPEDEELLSRYFHYSLLPPALPTDTAVGGAQLILTARETGAEVVIIDTFSRAVAGKEDDAGTAQDYYRYTGKFLKTMGVTVVRLDHHGKEKGRGGRGSSAKNDDVDVVWSLTSTGGSRLLLEATHQRVGWIPQVVNLERVEIGGPMRHVTELGDTDPIAHGIQLLDSLNASLILTRDDAAALLRGAGWKGRNHLISEILKARQDAYEA